MNISVVAVFLNMSCLFVQNADYTTGQVFDLSDKLEQSEAQLGRGGFMLGIDTSEKKSEDKLAKSTKDGYVLYFFSIIVDDWFYRQFWSYYLIEEF